MYTDICRAMHKIPLAVTPVKVTHAAAVQSVKAERRIVTRHADTTTRTYVALITMYKRIATTPDPFSPMDIRKFRTGSTR